MPIANGFIEKKYFNKEYFFDMQIGFSKKENWESRMPDPAKNRIHERK